jgi:peroxin-6
VEKVKACSPSILLIKHIEILSKKSENGPTSRPPAVVKVLEDSMAALREASGETGWPCLLLGTTSDIDATTGEVLGCFKQEIEIGVGFEPSQ